MPIEFKCTHCHSILRTPDDSAGKQSRCPQCGIIQSIPSGNAPSVPPVAPPTVKPASPTKIDLPTASNQNQFADQQRSQYPATPEAPHQKPYSHNPYSAPASHEQPQFLASPGYNQQQAQDLVKAPAIALIVINSLRLLSTLFVLTGGVVGGIAGELDSDDTWFMIVAILWGMMIGLTIFGNISMLVMKRYVLSVTATGLSIFTGDCCPFTIGFGIWAFVVLMKRNVSQGFS